MRTVVHGYLCRETARDIGNIDVEKKVAAHTGEKDSASRDSLTPSEARPADEM